MKKLILFALLFTIAIIAKSQEMIGIIGSTNAGVNVTSVNPSFMADSKYYLDVNILSTNIFYQTDMVKNGYGNFRLNGPSFMLNKGSHNFAFVNAARTGISYKKTSSANGLYNEFNVAGIAWGEAGLSYAYTFKRFEKSVWSAGATVKFLFGAGGAYYASTSAGNSFNNSAFDNIQNSGLLGGGGMGFGKGIGFDVGFMYQKKINKEAQKPFVRLCQQKYYDYKYKIGISIIDIGALKFSKSVSSTNFNVNLIGSDTSSTHIDSSYNVNNSSLKQDKFSVALPTAIAVQFDYHLSKNWYFNGLFFQSLQLANYYVRRPTMFSFTPRYEKKLYEISLPVSVSDFKYYRIGLALRFWKITIGSDNLLGSFGVGANRGFDVYAAIKINFLKGKCRERKRKN